MTDHGERNTEPPLLFSKEVGRRTEASSFTGDSGGDLLDRGNRCIRAFREGRKPDFRGR
jgi:hypothetical protein